MIISTFYELLFNLFLFTSNLKVSFDFQLQFNVNI